LERESNSNESYINTHCGGCAKTVSTFAISTAAFQSWYAFRYTRIVVPHTILYALARDSHLSKVRISAAIIKVSSEHDKTLITYFRSLTCHSYKLSFTSSTEYIPVEISDRINYAPEV